MARSVTTGAKKFKTPILLDSAEMEVIRALRRQGNISRTDISNITGWSKAKATQEIRSLIEQRTQARKSRNFALADQIRDQIHELGYVIEDTKEGIRWKKR